MLKEFDLVIISKLLNYDRIVEMNKFMRFNNIKFIFTVSFGLLGFSFQDFGDCFITN